MSNKNRHRWQTDKQIDGNERSLSSYSGGHETSRKHETGKSADGLDYYTSLAYAWKVKQ